MVDGSCRKIKNFWVLGWFTYKGQSFDDLKVIKVLKVLNGKLWYLRINPAFECGFLDINPKSPSLSMLCIKLYSKRHFAISLFVFSPSKRKCVSFSAFFPQLVNGEWNFLSLLWSEYQLVFFKYLLSLTLKYQLNNECCYYKRLLGPKAKAMDYLLPSLIVVQ